MVKVTVGVAGGLGDGLAQAHRPRWLRRCLGVAALALALVAGVPEAQAGWSPAARVLGQGHFGYAVVAFDAHDTPWVAWSVAPERGVAPSGLFVAQLTGHYRLASVSRVPGPHPEEIVSAPAFTVDSAGFGVLAWQYATASGFAGLNGVAVTTWPLGGAPSRRNELISPTSRELGPVSLATDLRGNTVVLYSDLESPQSEGGTRVGTIDAARLRAGEVLTRRRVATIVGGPTALDAQVAPGTGEGFQATWELEGGESDHFAALGVETAQAMANGSFSTAQLTPWPAGFAAVTYQPRQIITGPHGDQVAWWTTGPEGQRQNLYVASRHRGQSFSAPQLIGRTEGITSRPEIVITRAGRFTIAWMQPDGAKLTAALAAAGSIGGKLGPPHLLARGATLGELELVLTQGGEAVAAWWQVLASGELLVQAAASAEGTDFTVPDTIFRRSGRSPLACGRPSLWPDRSNGVLAGWTCNTQGGGQHEIEEFSRYQP